MTNGSQDEERLFERLKALVSRSDPVPGAVVAAARDAFGRRRLDGELAALVYDSALDDREAVGVRGAPAARQLTFAAPSLTVEIDVLTENGRLVGQVIPAQVLEVEVSHSRGRSRTASDDLGRFVVDGVAPGPVSVRCTAGDGSAAARAHTDWVMI